MELLIFLGIAMIPLSLIGMAIEGIAVALGFLDPWYDFH